MFSKRKIPRKELLILAVGLGLTIAMMLLIGAFAVHQLQHLQKISKSLYEHPFKVTIATDQLQSDIEQIRISNLQIALTTDPSKIKIYSDLADAANVDAMIQLDLISSNFLGDLRKVTEIKREMQGWEAYRHDLIAKISDGTATQSDKVVVAEGSEIYKTIYRNVAYVSSFASNRAKEFVEEAALEGAQSSNELKWLTILVVSMMSIGFIFTYKTIQTHIRELDVFAHVDVLTQLLNRRQFNLMAGHEFGKLARYDGDLSVMMIDIDHFKQINDLHGHSVGDAVLISLAQTLRVMLRDSDLICRWGGEEFVVLLPQINAQSAYEIADRIRNTVATTPAMINGVGIGFTISIGVAEFSDHLNVEKLIAHADTALYHVKNSGRNSVAIYTAEFAKDT